MKYDIVLTRRTEKDLERLPEREQERIWLSIDVLKEQPRIGKLLQGEYEGYRSYRVGTYRILYAVDHRIIRVTVLRIAHRKDVYR